MVQTRSPLVTRDIDLLARFESVQLNRTVTTDSEEVRRVFEPLCPTNGKRLAAIGVVAAAGVPALITLTPLLPIVDPDRFARDLRATGVRQFAVQPFHAQKGRFVAGTRTEALALVDGFHWTDESYRGCVDVLRSLLPSLKEGRTGFAPP